MKNNKIKIAMLAMTLLSFAAALTSCNGGSETSKTSTTTSQVSSQASQEVPGEYTRTDGGVTYTLKVLDNMDFELQAVKNLGTYTATKYYAGPLKDIDGLHMAAMVVFLSDFTYEGSGAPDDNEEVLGKLQEVMTSLKSVGENEPRKRFITLDPATRTYTVDTGKEYTTLDYTDGLWTSTDFDNVAVAGNYTVTDSTNNITYTLKVLENMDFELQVAKKIGTYTATKYYAGPLKDIDGLHMAAMVVFLSDFTYTGEGAPSEADNDAVLAALQTKMTELKAVGENEPRKRFITLKPYARTYTVDTGKTYSTLDYTDGYWTKADLGL